jgi:hypothetical protein
MYWAILSIFVNFKSTCTKFFTHLAGRIFLLKLQLNPLIVTSWNEEQKVGKISILFIAYKKAGNHASLLRCRIKYVDSYKCRTEEMNSSRCRIKYVDS